tara:strand:- start:323 stop:1012 length:690 start_codon:yes stop_codon:yes gene_type:complete
MKTNTLLTLFAAVLILFPLSSTASEVATSGAEVGKWTMDYEAAAALAKEKKLPMLLNFTGSDWCGWCKLMDKAVYAEDDWKTYAADKLVLVTIDFPQDSSIVPKKFLKQNEELKSKFEVRGYPSYVILDSDGETKLGQLGAGQGKTPSSFIEEVEGVTRLSQSSIDAKVAELGEPKGSEYLKAIKSVETEKSALDDWIATGPAKNEENNKKFEAFNESIAAAQKKLAEY